MSTIIGLLLGAALASDSNRVELPKSDGYVIYTEIEKKEPGDWFFHDVDGYVVHIFKTENQCRYNLNNRIKDFEGVVGKDKIRVYTSKNISQCYSYTKEEGPPVSDDEPLKLFKGVKS